MLFYLLVDNLFKHVYNETIVLFEYGTGAFTFMNTAGMYRLPNVMFQETFVTARLVGRGELERNSMSVLNLTGEH